MINVLVVDDSVLIRHALARIIDAQPDMRVIADAADGISAQQMIRLHTPDVITLDIQMPNMDGLQFLEKLMQDKPLPVIMVSSLTEKGASITLRALEMGAIDFVHKPKLALRHGLLNDSQDIIEKIRMAYAARHRVRRHNGLTNALFRQVLPNVTRTGVLSPTDRLIMIGSSTGGTEALRIVLQQMPLDCPAVLITQHMPAGFTKSFAKRLDQLCAIAVKEAAHGDAVLPGHAYIAPGDRHLKLGRGPNGLVCLMQDGPPVNRHKPSVEVLFDSGAALAGRQITGVMLTGMGKDGAQAMLRLREAGAYNICQDEASCVVFGMPREAIALGAAHEVVSLEQIPKQILAHLMQRLRRPAVV
ncbi:MAG: chemotaxis response regulator protein-glutamate methylesterase [Burkholderiaceae bacterium]|jgi:two-component system chemotaxis response regulator CheB